MNPWISRKTFVCHWSISLGPNSNGYSCRHPRPENSPPTRFFFRYNTYFTLLFCAYPPEVYHDEYHTPETYECWYPVRDYGAHLYSRNVLICTSRHVEFQPPKHFGHVLSPPFERAAEQIPPRSVHGELISTLARRSRGFWLVIGEPLWLFTGDNLITIRVRTLLLTMTTRMQTGFRKRRQNYNNLNFNLVFYSWIGVKMSAVTGRQTTISVYDNINCHPSWRVSIIRKRVNRPDAYARI